MFLCFVRRALGRFNVILGNMKLVNRLCKTGWPNIKEKQ